MAQGSEETRKLVDKMRGNAGRQDRKTGTRPAKRPRKKVQKNRPAAT